ncbi:MAG TPA: LytTR family DNA-binding domain-containing protein [Saprospiraceae bacterium]|nr:LytTR family DNA-binding domain-containing protein [Saprospiraceae bacterium]HMQ82880.1 LytTR family DNA-binding domain-containing protein [Saprospiraceae bacterium]
MKVVQITNNSEPLLRPLQKEQEQQKRFCKIALPSLEGFVFKRVDQIVYLEAQGNYTQLQFADKSALLVCKTLLEIEKLLEQSASFIRVHRSFVINPGYLDRYIKGKGGYVVMEGGKSIPVSDTRKAAFLDAILCL